MFEQVLWGSVYFSCTVTLQFPVGSEQLQRLRLFGDFMHFSGPYLNLLQ